MVEAGALLAQDVDGLVDFGFGHIAGGLGDFLARQITHGDFRVDFEHGGESERLAGGGLVVKRLEARVAGDVDFLFLDGLGEALLHFFAQHVFTHLCAVVLLDDLQRGLARTEALHLGGARHALQALGHLGVDVGHRQGDIQAAFQCAKRFELNLHCLGPSRKVISALPRQDAVRSGRRLGACVVLVREKGLEPLHLSALEPKSSASTNSATLAKGRPYTSARTSRKHTVSRQGYMNRLFADKPAVTRPELVARATVC